MCVHGRVHVCVCSWDKVLFWVLIRMRTRTKHSSESIKRIKQDLKGTMKLSLVKSTMIFFMKMRTYTTHTATVLCPIVRDFPGELVPEETLTHPPSWSSSNLYQLLPSTTIHSILLVQITCLAIFLHNLSPRPLWSTCWSGALHLIFHTFLNPIIVFFFQHMPIPSQPVLL